MLCLVNKARERKYSRIIEYSELNFVALVEVAAATRLDPGENQKLCRTPKLSWKRGPLGEKVMASHPWIHHKLFMEVCGWGD